MEGIISRNRQRQIRNSDIFEYNEAYIQRGLAKAFGYPGAWLTAILALITIYERMRKESDRRDSGQDSS